MSSKAFVLVYVIGFVAIRVLSRLATQRAVQGSERRAIVVSRIDLQEVLVIGLFLAGGLVLPLVAFGPWLPEYRYTLPDWVSWTGALILGGGGFLHWRAHADLGRNYSATVLVRESQALVTNGVYAWIRHPIYASLWLIVISQPLLVHHWIYGLAGLPTFALLFLHRRRREEAMMIETFGDQYRDYMRKVGGVIPTTRRRR